MGAAGPSSADGVGKTENSTGDSAGGPLTVTVLNVVSSDERHHQAKDVCFMPTVARLSLPSTLSKCPKVTPSVPGLQGEGRTSDEAPASSAAESGCMDVAFHLKAEAVHSASTTPSAPSSVVSSKLQSPDIREWRVPQAHGNGAQFLMESMSSEQEQDDHMVEELEVDALVASLDHGHHPTPSDDDGLGSVHELAGDSELLQLDDKDLVEELIGSVEATSVAVGEVACLLDKLDDAVCGAIMAVREDADNSCYGESLPSTAEQDTGESADSLPHASCSDSGSERLGADPRMSDLQDMLLHASLSDTASERRPSCLASSSSSDERTERRRSVRFQTTPECVELHMQEYPLDVGPVPDSGSAEVFCSFPVAPHTSLADSTSSADVLHSPQSPSLHCREPPSPEQSAASLLRRSATMAAHSTGGSEAEKAQFEVQFLVLQELLVEMQEALGSPEAASRQRTIAIALSQTLQQLKPRHPDQVKLCEEFKEALSASSLLDVEGLPEQSLLPMPASALLQTPPAERRPLQAGFATEPGCHADLSKTLVQLTPLALPCQGTSLASRLRGSRGSSQLEVDEACDNCSADGEFSWELSEVGSSVPSTLASPAISIQDLEFCKAEAGAAARSASQSIKAAQSYSERLRLLKFVQEMLQNVIHEKPEDLQHCAGAEADAGAGAGISTAAASHPSMETLARAAFGKLWQHGGAERCSLAGLNECSVAADGAASFRPISCEEQTPPKKSVKSWPKLLLQPDQALDSAESRCSETSWSNSALASPTFGGCVDESPDKIERRWPQNDEKLGASGRSWPTAATPQLLPKAPMPQAAARRAVPTLATSIDGLGGGTFSGLVPVTLESPTDDVGSCWAAAEPFSHGDKKVRSYREISSFADAIAGAVGSGGLSHETPAPVAPPLERPVSAWSVDDVRSWAASLAPQLPVEIAQTLAAHAINGQVLVTLTESELWSIGITKFGWRRQLVLAVQELVASQQQEHDKRSDRATSQDTGEAASTASRPTSMTSSPPISDSPRRPAFAASPPAPFASLPPRLSPTSSPASSSSQLTSSIVLHLPEQGLAAAAAHVKPAWPTASIADSRSGSRGRGVSCGSPAAGGGSAVWRPEVAQPANRVALCSPSRMRCATSRVAQGSGSGFEAARGRDVVAKRDVAATPLQMRTSTPLQRAASPGRAPSPPHSGGSTLQKPSAARSSPAPLPPFYCQLPRTESPLQPAKLSPKRLQSRGNTPQRC